MKLFVRRTGGRIGLWGGLLAAALAAFAAGWLVPVRAPVGCRLNELTAAPDFSPFSPAAPVVATSDAGTPAAPSLPEKWVCLTFDDGPGVYTSTLLDTLEQYGAQATFFMLGSNVEKYGADVIPRMAAIGCELGNHSYAHPNMKELSLDDGLAQFQMTDDLIAQYNNGQGATVIRFPYGNSTDELLASIGRPSIMWDVDTLDWQTKNVQANISAVLDSVSPGDIILMHDIHETTVESCATIVPELINRGYELVTIHTLAAANGVDLAAGETYYGFHGGTTNE